MILLFVFLPITNLDLNWTLSFILTVDFDQNFSWLFVI